MLGQDQKLIRSFGRIKSRKLSESKQQLLDHDLQKYAISSEKFHQIADYSKYQARFFEIGFGFGDYTAYKAKLNPDSIFFGCEPHIWVSLIYYH